MRVEGSHESSIFSLGPEVRVYLPQAGFGRQIVDSLHRRHSDARADLYRPVIGEVAVALDHEDHVDV